MGGVRASLIIPTRDNIPFLSNCVESALETLAADDEIIIVGNGTADEVSVTHGYACGMAEASRTRGRTQIRFVESDPGYVAAVNRGLETATGKFIIIGNDDVMFAPKWLDEMIEALVRATMECPDIKWGFVGPHTNCGLPVQTLTSDKWPMAHDPKMRDETVEILAAGNHPKIVPSGALSGFCLLITRECYEAVGKLDESYIGGGFTDNDWQLRGQEKGFLGLLAPRAFVFHAGHVSMDRYTPGHQGGVENLQHHMRKWYHPRKQFLTVAYRVQINTPEDRDLLLESLRKSSEVADACVILDDRSKFNLLDVFQEAGLRDFVKAYRKNPIDLEFNEVRDRDALMTLARTTRPDWILNLDHDEVLDDRVTRANLDRLMNPTDPAIKCYIFPIFTFWRGKTHVRLDSVWGNMTLSTLFKNEPCWGGIYQMTKNSTFHCRRVPTWIPTDMMLATKLITVKHYGYYDVEKAATKRAYYVEKDTDKVKGLVGTENYEHLTDETSLTLLPYSSPTLTVALLVKNDVHGLAKQLRSWAGFAEEILIVDTGSTDEGPEFARLMGARVETYRCCEKAEEPRHLCDFSAARNFAIEEATGDFILFMDPDEQLVTAHTMQLPRMLLQQADGYMVWIHNLMPPPKKTWRTQQPRLFRRDPRIRYSNKIHETLSKAFEAHRELGLIETSLQIDHYGFLQTTGQDRDAKNRWYAEKLVEMLEENPEDGPALLALANHLIDIGKQDDGDTILDRCIGVAPNLFQARWELACRLVERGVKCILDAPSASIPKPETDVGFAARLFLEENAKWCNDLPKLKATLKKQKKKEKQHDRS